jgi:plasmid stabilization system protein ParE
MNLTLLPEAERDIEEIILHSLIRFGPVQAKKYNLGLTRALHKIKLHPKIAPLRRDYKPQSYRVSVYRAHVIIYTSSDDAVTIIRVLDARRDWHGLFD